MLPDDDDTPYGYRDNPFHCWKLHRSGVVRMRPPLGFEWLFPNVEKPIYRSRLNIGFEINGTRLLLPDDIQAQSLQPSGSYHSKNLFRYHFHFQSISAAIEFFLADENALIANLPIETESERSRHVALLLAQTVRLNCRCCIQAPAAFSFSVMISDGQLRATSKRQVCRHEIDIHCENQKK